MATPKQIYIPQIDSTIEVPEGMDEETAKQEALSSYQETFPDDYQLKQKAIEEFKKQLLDPIDYGDEDQPANSAPIETQNTNQAPSTKQQKKLPFENIATMGGMGMVNPALDSLLGLLKLTGVPDNKYVKTGMRFISPLAGASLLDKGTQDAAANSAAESMTANLVNPLKAGAATTIDELMQLIGASEEKSASDTYKGYRDAQKGAVAKRWKEHPIASLFGTLEGAVNPESVGTQLFTKGGKLVEGATSKVIQNFPTLKKLLDAALTGAGTNLAYQAVDPELDIKNPWKTAGYGALLNLAPTAAVIGGEKFKNILKSGKEVFQKSKPYMNGSQSKIKGIMDSVGEFLFNRKYRKGMGELEKLGLEDKQKVVKELLDSVDDAKKGIETSFGGFKFENQLNKLKGSLGDKESIANQFVDAADSVKKGVTSPYSNLKRALIKGNGDTLTNPKDILSAIEDIFKSKNLISAKGKIDLSGLSKYNITEDRLKEYTKLAEFYGQLKKGDIAFKGKSFIPIKDLDEILGAIGDKAKFSDVNRGPIEKIMGGLYNKTKASFDEALQGVAGSDKKTQFQNLRKNVSDVLQTFGKKNIGVDKIVRKEPQQIISTIASKNTSSYLSDLVNKYPKLKTPTSNALLKSFTDKAQSREDISKFVSNYGVDALKKILPKDKFDELIQASGQGGGPPNIYDDLMGKFKGLDKTLSKDSSQIIDSIKTNFRPDYTKEIISQYPNLKGSVEKAVLSHFFNKATDPQSLARLMKGYGEKELAQILSKDKFSLLQKMIGNKEFFQKVKSQGLDWSGVKAALPRLFDSKTQ